MNALDHISMTCCHQGCSAIITLHRDEERRLRRSHDWFYCSNGHRQHYSGKTDEEKKIETLESKIGFLERRREDHLDALEGTTKVLGVCPFGCGWKSKKHIKRESLQWGYGTSWNLRQYFDRVGRDMAQHLHDEHGARISPQKLLMPGPSPEPEGDSPMAEQT